MLKDTVNDKRLERHHITQEDFTPENICDVMFKYADELYVDFTKTVLDPCCGIGNLLTYILKRRVLNCKTADDLYQSVSTLYGTELMEDNVMECKENIIRILESTGIEFDMDKITAVLESNIICTDSNDWNYEEWQPKPKYDSIPLF